MCTHKMLIAAVFIVVKTWKQPKCYLINQQPQTMEYLALKTKQNHTWRNVKYPLLTERKQSEKAKHGMIPTLATFWKRQSYGDSENISEDQVNWREKQSTKDFQDSETILCDTTFMES